MTPESSLSSFLDRWPAVNECAPAVSWLRMRVDLGLAEGTVTVYARSLDDYLAACGGAGINPLQANQGDVARWIHQLDGLSNATLQLRLVAVRLFYDYLVEEGIRSRNPVGRGRRRGTDQGPPQRGLLPKLHKQPWIPSNEDWLAVLTATRTEPIRNRLMIGFAYDAGLRREELCALRTDDIDPAHRTVRVRAETTKTGYGRVVPYSEITGNLLQHYLGHRSTLSRARGPLFLSESKRNRAMPITLWTWSIDHLCSIGYRHDERMFHGVLTMTSRLLICVGECHLEAITADLLGEMLRQYRAPSLRRALYKIAQALHGVGILAQPVRPDNGLVRNDSGIDPTWLSLAVRWHATSTLSKRTRADVFGELRRTGPVVG